MDTNTSASSFPWEKPKMSRVLNVLTVLSIIGSIMQFIGSITGFFIAQYNLKQAEDMATKMEDTPMPSWVKNIIGSPETQIEIYRKSFENRIPLLVLGLLSACLCLYGVLQMRKLKMGGFSIYVIGQLLAILMSYIFIGSIVFEQIGILVSVFFTLLFIFLYWSQRGELKGK